MILQIDDSLGQGDSAIERTETNEDFVFVNPADGIDLNDDFDDSAYADEDDDDDDEIIEDDEEQLDREDLDDDEPRERVERAEGEGRDRDRGRGRKRRRGGRRDEEVAVVGVDPEAPTLVSGDDDDDSEAGRRRRRGRRGGRRIREDGEGAGSFFWVRGRTPNLDDPYVWFDPINPEPRNAEPRAERTAVAAQGPAADVEEPIGERPEGEIGGDREGGRSRRRRRGRGRGERAQPHDLKVEARATNEGMPPDGSPDSPMAVVIPEGADADAPALPAEPQRRRVRRKPASASAATLDVDLDTSVEPNEVEPVGEPVVLDVPPVEAAAEIAETEAVIAEAVIEPTPVTPELTPLTPAPAPEADLSAIIANDPAQIAAPPEKPKRGWWRR